MRRRAIAALAIAAVLTLNACSSADVSSPADSPTNTSTAVAAKTYTHAPAPTIAGSPEVGEQLTAAAGAWTPRPTSFAYQWYRSGSKIAKATHKTYTVASADVGHRLTVVLVAHRSGYTDTKRTSAPTASIPAVETTTPSGGGSDGGGGSSGSGPSSDNSSGSGGSGAPPGATALCNDGTYSYSQHRSGTCSHHGGVAQWL